MSQNVKPLVEDYLDWLRDRTSLREVGREHGTFDDVLAALRQYGVQPIPWSARDKAKDELAA